MPFARSRSIASREQVDPHRVAVVDRDRAHAAGAEPERAQRLVVGEMELLARRRPRARAARARPARATSTPCLRPNQWRATASADGVRHRRARAEVARSGREAEQVGEPADRDLLELDAGRAERPHADVLIDGRRPGLDDRRSRQRAARDVAEVAPAGAAREAARRARLEVAEDRRRAGCRARAAARRSAPRARPGRS